MNKSDDKGANPIFGKNRLKLGTFGTNTMSTLSRVPELLAPTWENCLAAAKLADTAGFEAIVPVARWKGYLDGKPDHPSNKITEVFTFAAAIAQATSHSAVFATSHAPTIHPMAIAKQAATIDHISDGRFVLNVVGGWNRREFDMFGIDLLPHGERYKYLAEWLEVLQRLWTGEEFDLTSDYFSMQGALCRPVPKQSSGIPIMSAATSPTGMRFAAQYSDVAFSIPKGDDPSDWAKEVSLYKKMAREDFGRELKIWTTANVIQRETTADATAYFNRVTKEYEDVEAADSLFATLARENNWDLNDPDVAALRHKNPGGVGLQLIGSAEGIATQLQSLSDAGFDGVLMSWIDYIDGLHRFVADVLPLLEQAGLREQHVSVSINEV